MNELVYKKIYNYLNSGINFFKTLSFKGFKKSKNLHNFVLTLNI